MKIDDIQEVTALMQSLKTATTTSEALSKSRYIHITFGTEERLEHHLHFDESKGLPSAEPKADTLMFDDVFEHVEEALDRQINRIKARLGQLGVQVDG